MASWINRSAAYVVAGFFGLLGTMAFVASGSLLGLAFFLIGPTLAVAIHEFGHAAAAWQHGMRVHAIVVGPFKVSFRPTRLGMSDSLLGHDAGGYVVFDDSRGRYLTSKIDAWITVAGPLANLASTVLAWTAASYAPERVSANLLVGFAFVSFGSFIISAWPFVSEDGVANDARRLMQIIGRNRYRASPRRTGRSPWQAP